MIAQKSSKVMIQEVNDEQPMPASNERAVVWARQMMARKRAEQKRMVEEFKTNDKLKAALAELREKSAKSENDTDTV